MVRARGDSQTGDLLSWRQDPVVAAFAPEAVRAASLRSQIARAVVETLRDAALPREAIAQQMGNWLGEEISTNMLNAYASQAREDHTIPYLRLLALVHVTGDVRLMQLGAALFGHSVVADKYVPWVDVGRLADERDQINSQLEAARYLARKGGR